MKIVCIGRNYLNHIKELDSKKPDEPVIFIKPETSWLRDSDEFLLPKFSKDMHYEVELVLSVGEKIQKNTKNKISQIDKLHLGIDFTARDIQDKLKDNGLPWEKCKSFDNSAYISRESIDFENPEKKENINFTLYKNNTLVQNGNTNLMLFDFEEILEEITTYFTLEQGDFIFTGTPEGVGAVISGDILVGNIEDREMLRLSIK